MSLILGSYKELLVQGNGEEQRKVFSFLILAYACFSVYRVRLFQILIVYLTIHLIHKSGNELFCGKMDV